MGRPKKQNNYTVFGQHTIMELNSKKYCIIDTEDYDLVKDYNWCVANIKSLYVQTNIVDKLTKKRTTLKLHRLIMNPPKEFVIDHINHNTLDNTKSNLRVCTHKENLENVNKYLTNNSGYRGIYRHKKSNKWQVNIIHNSKNIYGGLFTDIKEANKKSIELRNMYFTHHIS